MDTPITFKDFKAMCGKITELDPYAPMQATLIK
jgi:hypothetical protein